MERIDRAPGDGDCGDNRDLDGASGHRGSADQYALTPLNVMLLAILMVSAVSAMGSVSSAVIDRLSAPVWETSVTVGR